MIILNDKEDMIMRKAVENNIGRKITVEELAFLSNLSLSSFKRKFNKIYGMAPQHWGLTNLHDIIGKLSAKK